MGKNSKKQFRRNERTYKGHHNLDKFLFDKHLERKPIAKDGSCLFRAVAEQVFIFCVLNIRYLNGEAANRTEVAGGVKLVVLIFF